MKTCKLSTSTALVVLSAMMAVPVPAQETPSAVSDPLKNYTLDSVVPARDAGRTEAARAVAKQWIEAAATYRAKAGEARALVKTRLTTKEIEIKALEARIKEAKASGDKAGQEQLKEQVKAQKAQLDALEGISKYAGQWDDLASSLDRAGNEWIEFLDAEDAVAQRLGSLKSRLETRDAGAPLPEATSEDFKLVKKLVDEYREFGDALEAHGNATKKLGQSSGAVLSALEKRLPKK